MENNLLPGIAIYSTLLAHYGDADAALKETDEIFQITRIKKQRKNELIGKLPFGYPLFKLSCKGIIAKQYPEEGWKKTWQRFDGQELYFDMNSCLYIETTKRFGLAV